MKGWIVEVATKRLDGGQVLTELWAAAVSDPDEAEQLVFAAAPPVGETTITAKRPIVASDLRTYDIEPGEAKNIT